jgi:hypothetical protein
VGKNEQRNTQKQTKIKGKIFKRKTPGSGTIEFQC